MIETGQKYICIKNYEGNIKLGTIVTINMINEYFGKKVVWFNGHSFGIYLTKFYDYFALAEPIKRGHPITSIFK